MGFSWNSEVSVGYIQEVKFINSYSRFATRCLKMGIKKPSTNPKKLKRTKLPGHELTKKESRTPDPFNAMLHGIDPDEWRELSADMEKNGWGYPFSETEEEVEAMVPEHRALYDDIKASLKGNHANIFKAWDNLNPMCGCPNRFDLLNDAFRVAVEHLLPGQGNDFSINAKQNGGEYDSVGKGASHKMAYIMYNPTHTAKGDRMKVSDGEINIPWGYKLTTIPMLDKKTSKMINTAFATIVEDMGLTAVGDPGHKLITASSGG